METLLFDFYGELLTDHQKAVYEAVVMNDYSCTEIAQEQGISRQGVHDMIKRCRRILEDYESKLHLVSQFLETKAKVEEIHCLAEEFKKSGNMSDIDRIEQISAEICEL